MRARIAYLLSALALVASPGPGRADQPPQVLDLILSCDAKDYVSGTRPKFTAKLKNISKEDVYVVAALDGSGEGWRYPRYLAKATCGGEAVEIKKWGRCGNKNSFKDADVKKLAPGDSIEPIGKGTFGQHELESAFVFDKPGDYEVTLTYDTDEKDDKKFDGDGGDEHTMLAKVLRTKVVSNTLKFKVTK